MLIGLAGIAAHLSVATAGRAGPPRPHRVRASFDDGQPRLCRQRHQGVHVADMPPHVGEHEHLGLARFPLQVLQIDDEALGHAYENRQRADARDGPGHWRESESVGEHAVPGPHPHGPKRGGEPIAPRRHGEAVFGTDLGGEFLFQRGRLRSLARGFVVAVKPPMPQHIKRGGDPLLGDRLLLGKAARECLHGGS